MSYADTKEFELSLHRILDRHWSSSELGWIRKAADGIEAGLTYYSQLQDICPHLPRRTRDAVRSRLRKEIKERIEGYQSDTLGGQL